MNTLRLIGWCFCAAGAIALLAGLWVARVRLDRVHHWQRVSARVLSSHAAVERGTETDEAFTLYQIQYSARGKEYRCDFKTWSGTLEEARAKADRHPAGSAGAVFCDPANPLRVDANLGFNAATLSLPVWIAGGGVCAILFGLLFVLLGRAGSGADLW